MAYRNVIKGKGFSQTMIEDFLTITEIDSDSSEQTEPTTDIETRPGPVIKWAGGKNRLFSSEIRYLIPLFPKEYRVYHEPFCGGAALFFALLPPNGAYLNDLNARLIEMYNQIQNNVEELISRLKELQKNYIALSNTAQRELFYYDRREEFNTQPISGIETAALFIFLNKTCFNGLYRESASNRFNVPFGRYENPRILDSNNLRAVNKLLQRVNLTTLPFEKAVEVVREKDFVYFDPPYYPLNETSRFTNYTENGFGERDQIRLFNVFQELHARGAYVMLSNSDTPFIRDLYRSHNLTTIMAGRAVNAKATGRGKISELLIRSYNNDYQKEVITVSISLPPKRKISKELKITEEMRQIFLKWEQAAKTLLVNTALDSIPVDAKTLKLLTENTEPRLLTKMDHQKDVPPILAKHGYFLLPVKNGHYQIVRGKGFHRLEPLRPARPFIPQQSYLPRSKSAYISEAQALDNAYNSGLLAELLQDNTLEPIGSRRMRTGAFSFRVDSTLLDVNGVQIELDRGLEGRDKVVLFEAKANKCEDFIIRQLFYPYLHYKKIKPEKKIIPIFFAYWPESQRYNFWVYKFLSDNDYNSIRLVERKAYSYNIVEPLKLEEVRAQGAMTKEQRNLIPQADDLNKIIELPFLIQNGMKTYEAVAEYFGFDKRQSRYYRDAAEAIGLVNSNEDQYALTEIGRTLIELPVEDQRRFFANLLLDFYLVDEGISHLKSGKSLSKKDLETFIQQTGRIHGTTIERRATSLWAWFRWLEKALGIIHFDGKVFQLAGTGNEQKRLPFVMDSEDDTQPNLFD